jgi:hypothetical protein
MESLLEDIPVNKAPEGFVPFIEKTAEIQEPEDEESPAIVETPETPVAEEAAMDETLEKLPQVEAPEEDPEAPIDPQEQPVAVDETPEQEQTSEVVFEQVEGPKVEVVSVKDEVQKIIVHLAPDKILEIDCEY